MLLKYSPAAGHVLIREALEDTIVTVPNPVGEEGSQTVPIPKGTQVRLFPAHRIQWLTCDFTF
jgi:hypothetical protein